MKVKFLHIADIHARDEDFDEIRSCLRKVLKVARTEEVDFTIIAGDIWDSKIWLHRNCCDGIIAWVRSLANLCPIYIVYGTPSHDIPGSLAVFKRINTTYPIMVAHQTTITAFKKNPQDMKNANAILALYPHQDIPATGNLDVTIEARRTEINRVISALHAQCDKEIGDKNIFKIFVGHLAVEGFMIPAGTEGYEASVDTLQRFDYAALGHVHPLEQVLPLNVQYSGALWHTDIADVTPKGFFIVTLDTQAPLHKTFHNSGSKPVERFDAYFSEDGVILPEKITRNAKVRFTIFVPANLRQAFDETKLEKALLEMGASEVKIIIRVMAEEIEVVDFGYTRETVEGDWIDKFKAYCDANEIEIKESLLLKARQVVDEVHG